MGGKIILLVVVVIAVLIIQKKIVNCLSNDSPANSKDKVAAKLRRSLDKAYDQIEKDLAQSPTFMRPLTQKYEIAALLISMADFISSYTEKDREWIVNQAYTWAKAKLSDNDISDYINDRMVLYGNVIRGQDLRGEWLNGDTSAFEENPISRCLVAFGDIIWNPDCADNYEDEPMRLRGMLDAVSFSTNNMKWVLHSLRDFCQDISKL